MPSKGVKHPYPARAPMADLDFMGFRRVILKSDQEPSIVTSVTLSRIVGTAKLCLELIPWESARTKERSSVLFNLCMDL